MLLHLNFAVKQDQVDFHFEDDFRNCFKRAFALNLMQSLGSVIIDLVKHRQCPLTVFSLSVLLVVARIQRFEVCGRFKFAANYVLPIVAKSVGLFETIHL